MLILSSTPLSVSAEDSVTETRSTELLTRLSQAELDSLASTAAKSALEQAAIALSRAHELGEKGDLQGKERALDIAEAATTLAERRLEQAHERELARVIALRKQRAKEKAAELLAQIARLKEAQAKTEQRP